MDNNFEKDFVKNVKNSVEATDNKTETPASKEKKRTKTIFIIILSLVILIETIAIIVLALLLKSYMDQNIVYQDEQDLADYVYDDDGSTKAMAVTCESDQGYYIFYNTGNYEKYEANFELVMEVGAYSIPQEDLVVLSPSQEDGNKTLSFVDKKLNDGDLQYFCIENSSYEYNEE